jgi:hypothetical protein
MNAVSAAATATREVRQLDTAAVMDQADQDSRYARSSGRLEI